MNTQTKTVHRFNVIWNYDLEESWLNEEAKAGWRLKKYFFTKYVFEKCEPGKYEYRIQLFNELPTTPQSLKYLAFLESMGISVAATWTRWVYLEKECDGTPFELFSDRASKMKHIKNILSFVNIIAWMNLIVGSVNIFNGIINILEGHVYGKIFFLSAINVLLGSWALFGSKRLKEKYNELAELGDLEE